MRARLFIISVMYLLLLSGIACQRIAPRSLSELLPPESERKATEQGQAQAQVRAPEMRLMIGTGSLSSKGLNINVEVAVLNINSVALDIDNLQLVARGGQGKLYLQETVSGGSIAPYTERKFTHKTVIPFEGLNEKKMTVVVDAAPMAVGITLPVSASEEVAVPDMRTLTRSPEKTLNVIFTGLTSKGLNAKLEVNVKNPNPLSLNIGDMRVEVRDETGVLMLTGNIAGGSIAPDSSSIFSGDMTLPMVALDEKNVVVRADAMTAISGATAPFSVSSKTPIPKLDTLVSAPEIKIEIEHKLRAPMPWPSLEVSVKATITNNNELSLVVGEIGVGIYKPDGSVLSVIPIQGKVIEPLSSATLGNVIILGADKSPPDSATLDKIREFSGLNNTLALVKLSTSVGVDGASQKFPVKGEGSFTIKLS